MIAETEFLTEIFISKAMLKAKYNTVSIVVADIHSCVLDKSNPYLSEIMFGIFKLYYIKLVGR